MSTARYIGDPEQFRACDANRAPLPDDLTAAAGNVIRITLPEGVPAPSVEQATTMFKGIDLTLMIGPGWRRCRRRVVEALQSVDITVNGTGL